MAANGGTPENNSSRSSGGDPKTRRGRVLRRWHTLNEAFRPHLSHYRELSDYGQPRKGKFLREGKKGNKGRIRSNKIIDNKAMLALDVLKAGMMAGLTSPARPWFRLKTTDAGLMQSDEVKEWAQECARICLSELAKSNFYTSIGNVFYELGLFGTAAMYRQPTDDGSLVFQTFTAGEYRIATGSKGEVNTLARRYMMTVSQIVEEFLMNEDNDDIDWSKASQRLKEAWDKMNYDTEFEVVHIMQPRRKKDRNMTSPMQSDMAFENIYIEVGEGIGDKVLHEGGYSNFPCYVPRWEIVSNDEYGMPPMGKCLGDSKQLQQQQRRKAQGIEANLKPPVAADISLKGRDSSIIPGGITFVNGSNGGVGSQIAPIIHPQPYIRELSDDMREVRMRISVALYEPLFAQFAYNDPEGDKMTAEEIAKRDAERLVLLTPTLQNLNKELLSPVIKDVFIWAGIQGKLPPAPMAIEEAMQMGDVLEIEYISLLAQAAEAVYANAIERVTAFAGNQASLDPSVMDNLDTDEGVRQYARILGVDEKIIRDPSVIAEIRKARAQEQQEQEMKEFVAGGGAESASKAAMNLHDIDQTGGGDALTQQSSGGGGL